MALAPRDAKHLAQILAGTSGRNYGHTFEKTLTELINSTDWTNEIITAFPPGHLIIGNPAKTLVNYVVQHKKIGKISSIKAWWLGGLATSGLGDEVLSEGKVVGKSKSDILLEITHELGKFTTGISVKTCNKPTPTNDQLYFTTASAFCNLLRTNGIAVSNEAEIAMKMFCGDAGYRPMDKPQEVLSRKSDPSRWFFEELPEVGRRELEEIFTSKQKEITRILLQKAYPNDPYPPQFLLHQTKIFTDYNDCEIAMFEMEELIELSSAYQSFWLKPYLIRKGSYKGDVAEHSAPRFGFIQFQRGGQKQHPTQLQFNLEAGYFYKLPLAPERLPL